MKGEGKGWREREGEFGGGLGKGAAGLIMTY
jgi:hypothetical protein